MLKKIFNHFEEVIGALAISAMVTIAFANVVTRYLGGFTREYLGFAMPSMAFTEEITINMFVWVTLLGVSIAFRKKAHLAVTFFYDLAPANLRAVFTIIASLFGLAFFGILAWLGGIQTWDEMDMGVTSDALALPTWIYTIGVPVFSVLIMVRIIQATVETLRERTY